MSDGVNKVLLIGNLGQDPELRYTQSGQAVMTMRLATNESYSKDGERQTRTEWHTVVLWGKRAEALEKFLQRGSKLFVEGRLQTRSYETRDGDKRYTTEIVASEIVLLGNGQQRESQRPAREQNSRQDPPPHDPDDEIPF